MWLGGHAGPNRGMGAREDRHLSGSQPSSSFPSQIDNQALHNLPASLSEGRTTSVPEKRDTGRGGAGFWAGD